MSSVIIDRSLQDTTSTVLSEEYLKRRVADKLNKELEEILATRNVSDLAQGANVRVKIRLDTPNFQYDHATGNPHFVVFGNDRYAKGDKIPKAQAGGSGGGNGSGDGFGEGEDEFVFELSHQAIMDHLFEGLGLPNMEERVLRVRKVTATQRAGLQSSGPAALLDRDRSFGRALARRHAFHRPSQDDLERMLAEKEDLEQLPEEDLRRAALPELERAIARMRRRRAIVPYFEPGDLRFRKIESVEEHISAAVVFCLLDVSGSMTQELKDLAKRFFWLLKALLEREYNEVAIVFIRHTDTAQEVDEKTFFYDTRTGGTVVQPVLHKMLEIQRARFPLDNYNVYVCQASDGETWLDMNGRDDARESAELLRQEVLPIVQYFAYLECREDPGKKKQQTPLWSAYRGLQNFPHFAQAYAGSPDQIWPVFSKLFRLSEEERRKRGHKVPA